MTTDTLSLIDRCSHLQLALDRYADRMDDWQQAADDAEELDGALTILAVRAIARDKSAAAYLNGMMKAAAMRQDRGALDRIAATVAKARATT